MSPPEIWQEKQTNRLVWVLAWIGVLTGVATLAIGGSVLTLVAQSVQEDQALQADIQELDRDADQISTAVRADLTQVMQGVAVIPISPSWRQGLDTPAARRLRSHPLLPLSEALQQAEDVVLKLGLLYDRCRETSLQATEMDEALQHVQQQTENIVHRLREAVEQYEGRVNLNLARRLRLISEASAQEVGPLARQIGHELIPAVRQAKVKAELAELALLCRSFRDSLGRDALEDLKDNQMGPSLRRLHQSLDGIEDPTSAQLLVELEIALLGSRLHWDEGRKTIRALDPGLFRLYERTARLQEERQALNREAMPHLDALASVTRELREASITLSGQKAEHISTLLQRGGQAVALTGGLALTVLLLVCGRLPSAIRQQMTALEELNTRLRTEVAERIRAEVDLRQQASDLQASQRQTEEQSRALLIQADELREATRCAEAASAAKNEFLANMSHEFRTPMNGILSMAELVLDGPLTSQQREYLSMVRSAAEALLRIISDILDFSKIEAGKVSLNPIEFDLRECVGDVLKTLGITAHTRNLELVGQFAPTLPVAVYGDNGRLRQVLINLVGNALKFTEQGEVVVRVRGGLRGAPLIFEVCDTGIGISPEKHRLIFQPFEQADGSTTRRYGGTGLGLAIVSRLVALMEGTIEVESTPGQGSVFRFQLTLPPVDSIEDLPIPKHWHGLPILVADDNATSRDVLAEILSFWGFRPTLVSNGQSALDVLERAHQSQTPFSLALLDSRVTMADGQLLALFLRERPELVGKMLLMLPAGRPTKTTLLESECPCLFKPIKESELRAALENAYPFPDGTMSSGQSHEPLAVKCYD